MFQRNWSLPKVDPRSVPPSRHVIFVRGFSPSTSVERVRQFFATESDTSCQVEFSSISEDRRNLFIALRFESHSSAKEMITKFDEKTVLEHVIHVCWFKDLRKARDKRFGLGDYRDYRFHSNVRRGFYRRGGGAGGMGYKFNVRGRFGDFSYRRIVHSKSSSRRRDSDEDDDKGRRRHKQSSRSRSGTRSTSRSLSNEAPRAYRSVSCSSNGSHTHSRRPCRSLSSSNKSRSLSRHSTTSVEKESPPKAVKPPLNVAQTNLLGNSVDSPKGNILPLLEKQNNSHDVCEKAVDQDKNDTSSPKPYKFKKTVQEKIKKKKMEIEKAYKKDCETIATVSKLLIKHDQELESRLLMSLQKVIGELGQQCVTDLRLYIDKVLTKAG